jgi:hypothetical protein
MRRVVLSTVTVLSLAGAAYGQLVVSTKAGMVHYTQGKVSLDGQRVAPKIGQFPEMKPGSLLATERGRAEVLLAPGMFLRMGEDTSVRMVNNALTDIRLELVAGSVLLEVAELNKDSAIAIRHKDATVMPTRNGLYRLDTDPAQLRVYDGKADVVSGDQTVQAKKGRMLSLDGTMELARFDTDLGDALHRWSNRRAGYLAMANVSAARTARSRAWQSSGWLYNPYFGMYTFIPVTGRIYSPFGYYYYSPDLVYRVYMPRQSTSMMSGGGHSGPTYNPNLGYSTSSSRSYGGYSSSGPSGSSSAPAASAPADSSPRSAPSASGRGETGGGRGR